MLTVKTEEHTTKRGKTTDLSPGALEVTGIVDPAETEDAAEAKDDSPLGRRSALADTAPAPKTGWERVESAFRLVSLIAIAASAVVSALNFYQGYLDTKKDRSIALMSDWQSTGVRDSYAGLGDVVVPAIEEVGIISASLPDKARQLARIQIGKNLFEELEAGDEDIFASVSAQIEEVIVFFSEVEFCVRANLCDIALLKDYFGTEVVLFWDYFQTYAQEQRADFYPTYGIAVESLAEVFSKP